MNLRRGPVKTPVGGKRNGEAGGNKRSRRSSGHKMFEKALKIK